jgi:Ca2+-transporting ATPase
VNDSIALKQADVGLAMGVIGTDVAREAADIVIADDNFATIVNAIEEGRNIIKNVKNSIIYLLSCNIAEAMSLIGGLMLGLPPLFLPIQLLYINLVTDGVPALALAYSPHEERLMKQGPKKSMTLLEKPDFIRIFLQGFFATVFVFIAYYFYRYQMHLADQPPDTWHNVGATAAFTVLALIQSFIFLDTWLEHRWFFKHIPRLKSKIFWIAFVIPFIAQAAILYIPSAELLFKVVHLNPFDFVLLTGFSSIILVFLSFVRLKHSHLSSKE